MHLTVIHYGLHSSLMLGAIWKQATGRQIPAPEHHSGRWRPHRATRYPPTPTLKEQIPKFDELSYVRDDLHFQAIQTKAMSEGGGGGVPCGPRETSTPVSATPFVQGVALRLTGRSCSPAPDFVFKLLFPTIIVILQGSAFLTDTGMPDQDPEGTYSRRDEKTSGYLFKGILGNIGFFCFSGLRCLFKYIISPL